MANETLGMSAEVAGYVRTVGVREPDVLASLRVETAPMQRAVMQISPEQGALMAMLVALTGARRILELGVFTGYSSLAMALALPDGGRITACDQNEEWTGIARRYWRDAGVDHKIDLRLAPALDTLEALLADGRAETYDWRGGSGSTQLSPRSWNGFTETTPRNTPRRLLITFRKR